MFGAAFMVTVFFKSLLKIIAKKMLIHEQPRDLQLHHQLKMWRWASSASSVQLQADGKDLCCWRGRMWTCRSRVWHSKADLMCLITDYCTWPWLCYKHAARPSRAAINRHEADVDQTLFTVWEGKKHIPVAYCPRKPRACVTCWIGFLKQLSVTCK